MPTPRTDRDRSWAALPLLAALALAGVRLTAAEMSGPKSLQKAEEEELVVDARAADVGKSVVPGAVWGTIYLSAGVALVRRRRPLLPARRYVAGLGLVAFTASSAAWSVFPARVLVNALHLVGAILIGIAAAHRYRADPASSVRSMAYVLGLSVVVHIGACLLVPSLAIHSGGRWMGVAIHPNTLGMTAACAIWANVAALALPGSRVMTHASLAGLSAAALVMSGSATSLAMALTAVVGVLLLSSTAPLRRSERRFTLAIAGLALGAASIAAVWRWDELTSWLGKTPDLTGRWIIWGTAKRAFLQRPWLGWSFDANASVVDDLGLPVGHFHNGVLDVAVRGGVIGLSLFLLAAARVARDVFTAARTTPVVSSAFVPLLAAIAVENVSEVTFLTARNPVWILLIFATFLVGLRQPAPRGRGVGRPTFGHAPPSPQPA